MTNSGFQTNVKIACLLAASTPALFAEEVTFKIHQYQHDHNGGLVETWRDVDQTGEGPAFQEVLFGEATFDFWSFDENGEATFLDRSVVNGFYSPSVRIETPDPNDTATDPRVRADQAFTVSIDGISPAYYDSAENDLQLLWNGDLYATGFGFSSSWQPDFTEGTNIDNLLRSAMRSGVSGSSGLPDQAMVSGGVETFSIWAPNSATGQSEMLDIAKVQIWPMPSASLLGNSLEAGKVYKRFEPVDVQISNLYARDTWGVRVVDSEGEASEILSGAVDADSPQMRNPKFRNFAEYLDGGGNYRFQVIQQADGIDSEPRILLEVPFTYRPSVEIRAGVYDQ